MTAKEKAKELFDRFDLPTGLMYVERKQCAIIAVDEVIEILVKSREDYKKTSQLITGFKDAKSFDENLTHTRYELDMYAVQNIMYWGMVKREIEEL
jgi:hypothetical protein